MQDMKMQDWKMRHKPAGFCRGWKMRDWKMWHKNTGLENAGMENVAQSRRGWKMQEWKKLEKINMESRM